jgi:hypothetical protein
MTLRALRQSSETSPATGFGEPSISFLFPRSAAEEQAPLQR